MLEIKKKELKLLLVFEIGNLRIIFSIFAVIHELCKFDRLSWQSFTGWVFTSRVRM